MAKKLREKFENAYGARENDGYQAIDETTVLERKTVEASSGNYSSASWLCLLHIYDFNSGLVTLVTEHSTADRKKQQVDTRIMAFDDVPNTQCIVDAHAALVALGGTPPALRFSAEKSPHLGAASGKALKTAPLQPRR